MKNISLIFSLCIFFNTAAVAQNNRTPFEKVFDIISSPRVFQLSHDDLMRELQGLCSTSKQPEGIQEKVGNIECIKEVGVRKFFLSGDVESGFIQSSFFGEKNCAYVKGVLMKNFGKPSKVSDECAMDWTPKRRKKDDPARYVGFEVQKEKDIIYFQIGVEQGDE